jgi:hypothetical protein
MSCPGQYARLLALALVVLVGATSAKAEWDVIGNPVCSADGDQEAPVIVRTEFPEMREAGSGRFTMGNIIAWADERYSEYDPDIFAQLIDDEGYTYWRTNGVPVCTLALDQNAPRIASDESGGAIIAWRDYRDGDGHAALYAQRLNSMGDPQWDEGGVLLCPSSSEPWNLCLIPDFNGGAIAAWNGDRDGDDVSDISAQRIDMDGALQWGPTGVAVCASDTIYASWAPVMCSDHAGGAIVAWYHHSTATTGIYTQRIDAGGNPIWQTNGEAVSGYAAFQPAIAPDYEGGAIISWRDDRITSPYEYIFDIFAQRVDADGNMLWPHRGVGVCVGFGHQELPAMVTDGHNGAVVVWLDERIGDPDLYAQRVDANGDSVWTDIPLGMPVCVAPGTPEDHLAVPDSLGGIIVVWSDDRSGPQQLYAQRIGGDGYPAWALDGELVTPNVGVAQAAACYGGLQTTIVTWRQSSVDTLASGTDIYAQRVGREYFTAIPEELVDRGTALSQNRPNPFRPSTTLSYDLPSSSHVLLQIFDLAGRLVACPVNAVQDAGPHSVVWDGTSDAGERVAAGIYFCRLRACEAEESIKVTVLK